MSNDQENPEVEILSRNQIWFKVDNKTSFELVAQSSFADWGHFAEPPSTIRPNSLSSGGHVISSHSPFTGSAGMVAYKIVGDSKTLYLRFLGSNPYLSTKSNTSKSAVMTMDTETDQPNYNWLYYREEKDDSKPFNGGTLKVTSQIGQADQATAIFTVTLEK